LILLGSERTLAQGGSTLLGLVEMCRGNGWMADMQPDTIDGHLWGVEGSSSWEGEVGSSWVSPPRTGDDGSGSGAKRSGGSPLKTPTRKPLKIARVNREALAVTRPVLNDIMNDVL